MPSCLVRSFLSNPTTREHFLFTKCLESQPKLQRMDPYLQYQEEQRLLLLYRFDLPRLREAEGNVLLEISVQDEQHFLELLFDGTRFRLAELPDPNRRRAVRDWVDRLNPKMGFCTRISTF